MWKHIASNALTLFIVILAVIAAIVAWGRSQYAAEGPLEAPICVQVKRGYTIARLSDDLAGQGAISSGAIFRIGARYGGKAGDLKAGSYLVPAHASMREITDIVTRGGASTCGTEIVYRIGVARSEMQIRELDPARGSFSVVAAFAPGQQPPARYAQVRAAPDTRYRIAMAEGTTVWQVVEALKAADFLSGEIKALPPEGMLAPDSYEVSEGDARADLLARMQAAQQAILDEAWAGRAGNLPLKTPEEALVLASIVEKETGRADERPLVASVFVNRLRKGMRLQTDPAVIYGITGGRGSLGRGLRQSELRKETPYNTYVVAGLPPTPIANPGRDAIEAVLHPADTKYLYFVADGSGGHAFAATLAEHNANVAKWRAIQAGKSGN